MGLNNMSVSVENVKLSSEFDRLRETLLRDEFADHLNRPLAFWRSPTIDVCRWHFSGERSPTC